MPIEWHTKNINIQDYYKIIRRTIMFNAQGGELSPYEYWQKFKEEWTVHIIPVDKSGEFSQFYAHLEGNIEVSDGIAWGITGVKEIVLFVVDTRNPFIIRSNTMPMGHELLHAIYQDNVGTFHVVRQYDAPEGRAGTRGSAATVIVHDNWYGSKEIFKFYIWYAFSWLPITIPYIPIKTAKQRYII